MIRAQLTQEGSKNLNNDSRTESEDQNLRVEKEILKVISDDTAWTMFPRYREVYVWQILCLQSKIDQHLQAKLPMSQNIKVSEDVENDKEFEALLLRYGNLLQLLNQINALPSPDKTSFKGLRLFATDPEMNKEQLLSHIVNATSRHDLVAPISHSFKNDWIFRIVEKLTWRLITKPSKNYTTSSGNFSVWSDRTVLKIARFAVLTIASVSLLIPIVILYFVTKGFWPVMVIILWTIAFTAVIALATDARNTEVLMATAAYAAVMVVFVRA